MCVYIYISEGTDSLFTVVQLAILLQTYSSFKMYRIKIHFSFFLSKGNIEWFFQPLLKKI